MLVFTRITLRLLSSCETSLLGNTFYFYLQGKYANGRFVFSLKMYLCTKWIKEEKIFSLSSRKLRKRRIKFDYDFFLARNSKAFEVRTGTLEYKRIKSLKCVTGVK